ncbi:ATP-binding protein [Pelobium sp.]|nr:ATP-binding protein [Pelobium sp.]MDA9555785.1 ATP-binding protein [Pelobium sp.]
MEQRLSFWNWSIKKLLAIHPDTFVKAKINIIYTILLLSIFKIVIVLGFTSFYGQSMQLGRAVILMFFYTTLLKLMLNNSINIKFIAHTLIWMGLLIVVSNILFFSQTVNLISLQFVYMVTLSSFYLLGNQFGILYSLIGVIPVAFHMLFGVESNYFSKSADTLVSPAFEIIAFLNFVTIIISHYLFQQAFLANVKEKEVLNEQLKAAVQEANQAAQSKSDFLSTMSHELRTPLNSVIGMTDLFLDNPKGIDREENLKILKFSAVSLKSVINDILDFNKLGSEKLNLESISINLYSLMQDICAGLELKANEKGIGLKLVIDKQIKGKHVISDPTRLTQIMYNLIGNAIKFTPEGSVTVNLKVLESVDEYIKVHFSVIDTGIGINKEQQEEIFEPFNQASSSTTRNYGGTGLGLPIVKRLLLLFGSQINLASAPDKGANFYFDIIFKEDKSIRTNHLNEDQVSLDLSALKVLVVEDNMMNRLLLKKVLAKWNNEPVFAENGAEAVQLVNAHYFDVILMDLHMPVMDGYTASKTIRGLSDKEKSQVPIIAFTASVSHNLDDKIKSAGMNDYIYKPFKPNELYQKLKEISLAN